MNIIQIIWILILIFALLPVLKQQRINNARLKTLRLIQKRRSSQVITLIHRQEFLSFLGIPLTRFINIEDSELILRAIRLTPDNVPIDLVLHTRAAWFAAEQMQPPCRNIRQGNRFGTALCYVGGTLIARPGANCDGR